MPEQNQNQRIIAVIGGGAAGLMAAATAAELCDPATDIGDKVPDLILADIVLGGGVVDIVAHGVIHGINREQDVPFLRRVDLHHGVTGFPVLLVHLGLERGGLYGVAAVEPHTVIDVLGVKGSSTHFDYLLS